MSRSDAIAQLQSLRLQAQAKAYPRSRLAIQEYMDPGTAAADVVALGMAIKALQAPARRRMPIWACVLWCVPAAFGSWVLGCGAPAVIGTACAIYAMA